MSRISLNTVGTCEGLRVITFENELLRVQILPEAGANISQITYLPLRVDLLWNNPKIAPSRHQLNACYDDVWSGGWDELFPNDEEAVIGGKHYPDHGELWNAAWEAEPFQWADEAGVMLRLQTPVSTVFIEKKITLRRGQAQLHFSYRLTNRGATPFPFLWKLHPAMRVTPQHRIDMPPMRVVREPAFAGTLAGAPLEFDWPHISRTGCITDLRKVPQIREREIYFFYGTKLRDGWCAITDTSKHLACGLHFDPAIFRSCWLFASYGGWRDYNVAVLEPCTGYPIQFSEMQAAGRARELQPEETLETEVLFTVQEGLDSVGGIDDHGVMASASRPRS
jgi:galactose mutarotase-like enzyme